MALRDLLEALEAEIDGEVAAAIQADEERAAAILAEGRRRAEAERERVIAGLIAEAVAAAESTEAEARAAARRTISRARQTALAAVREEAERHLADLPGTDAGTRVAALCLAEAVQALPDATTVRLHAGDAAAATGWGHDVVTDLTAGGAYAVGPDGSFVDNTLPTRLANVWPTAQVDLVRRWEGES